MRDRFIIEGETLINKMVGKRDDLTEEHIRHIREKLCKIPDIENGYRLFRFTDKQINESIVECVDKVTEALL